MELPDCAMIGNRGTVIVRLRSMDVRDTFCSLERKPLVALVEKGLSSDSGCELCSRNRGIRSDSDSEQMDRIRPYRASGARSRYVNVSAAVCLLLLVGGLSPQSSAAPHQLSRKMEDSPIDKWKIPNSDTTVSESVEELARKVANDALNALKDLEEFKDPFASQIRTFESFDVMMTTLNFDDHNWLKKKEWNGERVLPLEKKLHEMLSPDAIREILARQKTVLPAMYRGAQLLMAAFHYMAEDGLSDFFDLKSKVGLGRDKMYQLLLYFSDLLKKLDLQKLPFDDSDIPIFTSTERDFMVVVFRDSMNYLEFIEQVMKALSDKEKAKNNH